MHEMPRIGRGALRHKTDKSALAGHRRFPLTRAKIVPAGRESDDENEGEGYVAHGAQELMKRQ